MKRYFIRIAILAGVVIIGGIAIAQAQRNSNEVTVLPPSPTDRVAETYRAPSNLESRGHENPLRQDQQDQTATAMPSATGVMPLSQATSPGSYASDPFHANSIPAASSERNPVRAYDIERNTTGPNTTGPVGRNPIRRTAYSGSPESVSPEPTLAPPQEQEPLPMREAGAPAMVPPQPGLASEVARDNFPSARETQIGDPADKTGYKPYKSEHNNGQAYDCQLSDNYPQPNEPSRNFATPERYPVDPPSASVRETYGGARQDLQEAPDRYPPAQRDPSQPIGQEPDRLTSPVEERAPAPIDDQSRYEPSRLGDGSANPNYERGSGAGYGGTGDSGYREYRSYDGPASVSASRATQDMPRERYPRIEPVGAAPRESQGPTGVGQPARNRSWDGEQLPQLRVVKVAPKEIQVGKPAIFRVEIANVGRVTAHGVEVRDQIPQSTRLISTKPESVTDSHGGLVWQLGEMKPGEKASVEMKLMPTSEGSDIGSVAMVRFGTPASVRTVATRPMLEVEVIAEDHVMVQSDTVMTIRVSNPGSGVATGVVLVERIPQGLQHPGGAELEYEVGDLAPKASKTIQLKLSAVRPGAAKNVLIAKADGLKEVVRESDIAVVAPELQIAMKGPRARYLNRKVSYEVAVSNPGSAAARDVKLVATLPHGLKFVEANNNGHYDPNSRTIRWALAELPVNETGTVRLTALPVEMGDHAVKVQGTADRAIAVKEEQKIKVDGIAALRFEVVDVKDPVEVGSETAYEIRVLNQGTKDASNVAVQVTLPPGFELITAEGPGSLRSTQQNGQIVFDPIRRLAPKVDTTFRIRVRGRQAGDHRLRVELNSDDLRAPVVKEESTRVFGDK